MNSISIVSQEEKLFNETLENNIKLYRKVNREDYENILKITLVDKIRNSRKFRDDFVNFNVEYNDIKLPVRKTKNSAGYDFYIPFDAIINPNETILIPTGIKVIMNENEFLGIYVRSGLGTKYNLRMCNQVGIIDADYYNNIENEGHIFIKMQN